MTNPSYPYPETVDLRSGPDLHPQLLSLLPLVGFWRGSGKGGYPGRDDFEFAQEIRFSHDGRPFLAYESRSWVIDADGKPLRPLGREAGWWRPAGAEIDGGVDGANGAAQQGATGGSPESSPGLSADKDGLEVVITGPGGVAEVYVGRAEGTKIELVSDVVARTATAEPVNAVHRLYGIVEGALLYAIDKAASGHPLTPHLSARLERAC